MVVVDVEGYFVYGLAGFMGHLVDSTCYEYMDMPQLPPGLRIMADKGFPQRLPLMGAIRRRQGIPPHVRGYANR